MVAEAQSYLEALNHTKPRLIRSEYEAEAVQEQIDALMVNRDRSPEDQEYLTFLTRLLLIWEDGRYPPIHVDPLEVIKNLLADNGLRQADLVGPVFPTRSRASEALSGRRPLTYRYVERLATFFHVSPDIFFPPAE